MPSRQATFNRVARHLLRQKKRSANRGTCLLFHGPLRCAAGALIPRKEYRVTMEKRSAVLPGGTNMVCVLLREKGHDLGLVDKLQELHDTRSPSRWPAGLRRIAKMFDLDPSIVQEKGRW